jgi:WD40 repeat protein
MKRLILILLLAAAVLPAAAPAAGCSPLNCASSGTALGHGLLAVRATGANGPVQVLDLRTGAYRWKLPSGLLQGHTLVTHPGAGQVRWIDALTGQQTRAATYTSDVEVGLVGVSQDGSRAVLQGWDKAAKQTVVVVVGAGAQRTIRLPTQQWGFDALSSSRLYLLHYLKNGYEIRRYDLAAGKLLAEPLKDPKASSTIWGIPWSRVSSADGRYLFTLYVGSNGASMVHQLDLRTSTARCIDLPGTGDFASATTYALELSHDGRTLWAVSPGYGRVVGIDVRTKRVKVAFAFARGSSYSETPISSVSALSADGSRIAVGAGGELWFVQTATRTVVHAKPRSALALGFAPDGSKLWIAQKGDAVRPVPVV